MAMRAKVINILKIVYAERDETATGPAAKQAYRPSGYPGQSSRTEFGFGQALHTTPLADMRFGPRSKMLVVVMMMVLLVCMRLLWLRLLLLWRIDIVIVLRLGLRWLLWLERHLLRRVGIGRLLKSFLRLVTSVELLLRRK